MILSEAQVSRPGWRGRLRLGKLAYRLYYSPKAGLRKCLREGPLNLAMSRYGQREMEEAAKKLPPLAVASDRATSQIHFLSGSKFWYQTCFCAYTMALHAGGGLSPVIYDDGTLSEEDCSYIQRSLPDAKIYTSREVEERLDEYLPVSKFPTLRRRRAVYPHLKKLTDIHAGTSGWKLVLDSDMLFFRRPDLLLGWLRSPSRPLYMLDVESAYGYSLGLMSELAQQAIPEKLNVGLCGLRSDDIDWERLEAWCRIMLEREGSSYYQEQALTAMMLAGQACLIAPAEDYVIRPDRRDVSERKGVMHHYVAESKAWYFRYAWRRATLKAEADAVSPF